MAVEVYGGDPTVVATRDELNRIAAQLLLVAGRLREAQFSQNLFMDVFFNPLPNLQLVFLLPGVIEKLERLSSQALIAAESYFSSEARVTLFLTQLFEPLSNTAQFNALPNPISSVASESIARTAGALAMVGLLGAPSAAKSQLLGQAARVAAFSAGHQTPAAWLSRSVPNLSATGTVSLVSTTTVKGGASPLHLVGRLRDVYYSPAGTIRIQSYQRPGGRDLVVLIPGTQQVIGSSNPLNLKAGVVAFARRSPASQQGVEAAIRWLKPTGGDRVFLVGHSQGGLIAANIAEKAEFETAGLVTLGSPVSHFDLDVPTISLQHQSDPIPGLSGAPNPLEANWLTASFDTEFDDLVAAHHIDGYAASATELTESDNKTVRMMVEQMRLPEASPKEYLFELRSG